MKKALISILLVIIVIIAGILFWLDAIIKTGIETYGARVTGTAISVGSVSVSPFSGQLSIKNLSIANPEGFRDENAIRVSHINIDLDTASIFSDTVLIKNISIIEPSIIYETRVKGTNIGKISENAGGGLPDNGNKDEESRNSNKSKKKVIIENLYIKEGKVTIAVNVLNQAVRGGVSLPTIHLQDIGKEGQSVSFAEAGAKVFAAITQEIAMLKTNGKLLEDTVKGMTGVVEGLGGAIKGLLGK